MTQVRTSQTHPLQIAQVCVGDGMGELGITFCPGKCDPFAATGAWQRDLNLDLAVISDWQANLVLTLMEQHELETLKVAELGKTIQATGIDWLHLPIADFSIPAPHFEQQWLTQGKLIRQRLHAGDKVLVHCKGGLGRAGMISARLLVELGWEAKTAIRKIRAIRPGAIETPSQLALVRHTQKQES